MFHIPPSQLWWQRDQSCAVIDCINPAQNFGREVKDVADENVQPSGTVAFQRAHACDNRRDAQTLEQLRNGQGAEFRPRGLIAAGKQPVDIQSLAAEGDEHPRPFDNPSASKCAMSKGLTW